jgi:ER membrane protein complex subunit 4
MGKDSNERSALLAKMPPPVGYTQLQQIVASGAARASRPVLTTTQQQALTAKKYNKAMGMAVSPAKQLAMNAFMMWFSGNQLNIFSINTTSSAILTPLGALLSVTPFFASLGTDVDTKLAKAIFIVINLVWLAIGLYKMSSMRLLPTTSADWTGKLVWKEMMESTSIPPLSWS